MTQLKFIYHYISDLNQNILEEDVQNYLSSGYRNTTDEDYILEGIGPTSCECFFQTYDDSQCHYHNYYHGTTKQGKFIIPCNKCYKCVGEWNDYIILKTLVNQDTKTVLYFIRI